MECGYKQCVLTLFCGFIWIITVTSGATEEEHEVEMKLNQARSFFVSSEEHEVEMKLYQASVSDWNSSGRDKFKSIVAEMANSYCEGNSEACNGFAGGFGILYDEESAEKEKAYLVVKFSLRLPGDAGYLNKDDLEVITINSAKKLREQTDLTIVVAGEKTGPLPPDNTLNIAISVSAIAILIIMIIALLVMQHKCGGKKSHEDEKHHSKERVTVA